MKNAFIFLFIFVFFWLPSAFAGEADVVNVVVDSQGENLFDFDVTVFHRDTGWDHYADRWEVMDQEGTVLGTRVLYHPHVNEQPFTRSLSGVKIPPQVKAVTVRAHDSVHEYGGEVITVELPD